MNATQRKKKKRGWFWWYYFLIGLPFALYRLIFPTLKIQPEEYESIFSDIQAQLRMLVNCEGVLYDFYFNESGTINIRAPKNGKQVRIEVDIWGKGSTGEISWGEFSFEDVKEEGVVFYPREIGGKLLWESAEIGGMKYVLVLIKKHWFLDWILDEQRALPPYFFLLIKLPIEDLELTFLGTENSESLIINKVLFFKSDEALYAGFFTCEDSG